MDDEGETLRQLRAAEFKAGWRAGPLPPPLPLFNLICNPTKLVLKGSKPRHVVDSSSPHDGTSVNANIDRSQTRLFNTSFAQLEVFFWAVAAEDLTRGAHPCSARLCPIRPRPALCRLGFCPGATAGGSARCRV